LEALAEAWRTQCFYQFHDILCGCSIGSTYDEAAKTLNDSHKMLKAITEDSLTALVRNVDTGVTDACKLVVFNQLAWERTDLVETPIKKLPVSPADLSSAFLQDEFGNRTPIQVVAGKLLFIARGVPSLGCKVYTLAHGDIPERPGVRADDADGKNCILENESLRVSVNRNSGAINGLLLKSLNRDIADSRKSGTLNKFEIRYERPHAMSAWKIGEIARTESLSSGAEVKIVENGPVFAATEVKHAFLNSSLTQQIRIYQGLERIDFVTEVEWGEKGSADKDAPMLKVTFTPALVEPRATYEIPFGMIERLADGAEVPALRCADLSDANCGISLLNDCKYGHHADGNTLGLTLLRASYEPDTIPDAGIHRFRYSLYPHTASWREAGTLLRGAELNQPLLVESTDAHSGAISPGRPCLTCAPPNVLVSAVKKAEDDHALIVRLFESNGKSAEAILRCEWPVSSAYEVNPLEEQSRPLIMKENDVAITFGKHEIKTVKLYLAGKAIP